MLGGACSTSNIFLLLNVVAVSNALLMWRPRESGSYQNQKKNQTSVDREEACYCFLKIEQYFELKNADFGPKNVDFWLKNVKF